MSKAKKQQRKKEQIVTRVLIITGALIAAAALAFGIATLVMALQPISKAYGMEITSDDFVFHIDDEGDIHYVYQEVTDRPYLLKLQERRKEDIRFTSSDEAVAVVDAKGHVKAVGKGEADITVSVSDLAKTTHVTSYVRGADLSFEQPRYELNTGDELDLRTVISPADAVLFDTIVFRTPDEETIRLDQSGHLTALAPGLSHVTAEADGLLAEAEIAVYQPMTGIAINDIQDDEIIIMERGSSRPFTVSFFPENTTDPRDVHYTLSRPGFGEVDADGVFTALGRGPVTLTAECNGFKDSVSLDIHVTLADIQLNHEELTLLYQTQDQLTFSLIPEDTTDSISCSFVSENPDIVSVDENGLVTANFGGTAAIVVNVNGFEKRCVYTVRVPVTGVNISRSGVELTTGNSYQLSAAVVPDYTTEDRSITWVSDNPGIVSVDGNGGILAVHAGETYIHAVNGDFRASCYVRVIDPYSPEAIANRIISFGKQYIGTRYVYGGNSLTGGIDCSSFTMQCFRTQGIGLPRNSAAQASVGAAVPMDASKWRKGDLLFYAPNGYISHVAIYIGDGQILHAAQSVGQVNITPYNYNGYTPIACRRYF